MNSLRKGFTLIELLVVIGIIIILTSIVLVAVNPGRQFAQARNAQRKSDLLEITNGIYQFAAEHNGNLPDTDDVNTTNNFPTSAICIGAVASGCYDLDNAGWYDTATSTRVEMLVPTYLAALPVDPSTGDAATDTGYEIYVSTDGRVVVSAPDAEMDMVIAITR